MRLLASKMLKWHLLRAKRKQKTRENNNKKPHIELAILRTVNEWVGLTTTVDEAPSAVSGENGHCQLLWDNLHLSGKQLLHGMQKKRDHNNGIQKRHAFWARGTVLAGQKGTKLSVLSQKGTFWVTQEMQARLQMCDFCLVMVAPPNERQSV